jgi:beta-lactamase regulating signal transducer with metallopeptidase domain
MFASMTTAWLLTYLLHSTLFLGLVGLIARSLSRRRPALEETVWRFALVAALVTASVQTAAGWEPLAGRWGLAERTAAPAVSSPLATHWEAPRPSLAAPSHRAPLAAPAPAPEQPFPWTAWIAGLWSVMALALSLRWLATHLALHRRLRVRPEVVGGDMHALLRRLTGEAGLEKVRLTCSSRLPVPIALGLRRREICVPPRALAALSMEEQEGLLAHELAHLVRRDPFWLAFSHFLTSVFFFQPLNRMARRRLRELSELRSDEWAVGQTGRPLSLARCLAEVAGWSIHPLKSLPAPGMADRPSHLAQRIRRLLDGTRSPERSVRPVWLAAGMAVLLITVIAAAPGISAAGPEKGSEPTVAPQLAGPAGGSPAGAAPQLAAVAAGSSPKHEHESGRAEARESEDDELDVDIEPALAGLEDLGDLGDLDIDLDLGDLGPHLAEMGNLASLGEHGEMSEEEERALEARMDALNDRIEKQLGPQMEELGRRLEKQMEGFENSPAMQKLRAEADEMGRRAQPSREEIEKLKAEAEKLSAKGHMTAEEREHLREQARAMAEKYRMSDEEREHLREIARQAREEHALFMQEHGAEIEKLRRQIREQAQAMREDIRRQIESDPQLRALRERRREEMKKDQEERREHREEIRKEHQKEREKRRESRQDVRQGVEGGVRGGVEGGVQGGVAGGVEGGR